MSATFHIRSWGPPWQNPGSAPKIQLGLDHFWTSKMYMEVPLGGSRQSIVIGIQEILGEKGTIPKGRHFGQTAWKMKEIGLKGRCSREDISIPPPTPNAQMGSAPVSSDLFVWGFFSLFFSENSGQQPWNNYMTVQMWRNETVYHFIVNRNISKR